MSSERSIMIKVTLLVLILAFIQCVLSFDSRNVVFIIISQPAPYQASVAAKLKQDIEAQVLNMENRKPTVLLTHEDYPIPGAWTFIPLLEPIAERFVHSDVRWVLFVEAQTAVRCDNLFRALEAVDKQQEVKWIGYPLSDDEPTIIHHFKIYEELEEEEGVFVYPNLGSGFAMKMELIHHLVSRITAGESSMESEFSIDPVYELAQFVYASGNGPLLTADHSFCVVSGDNCATYPTQFYPCGSSIPQSSILFAVKTWSGFHHTRAKVLKKTWGRYVSNMVFYSDKDDPKLPAVSVGIPNTKTGHCEKTIAILKMATHRAAELKTIKWIFLADDDTIISVQRLCEVLSCYEGGDAVTVLGERYGYGYGRPEGNGKGYDYPSAGGGVALSGRAARILSTCACAARAAPDDMTLGACALRRYNISITHSPLFHQARPQDYAREVLARDRPLSFHRHSSPDPLKVYQTWFQHDDLALRQKRDEL